MTLIDCVERAMSPRLSSRGARDCRGRVRRLLRLSHRPSRFAHQPAPLDKQEQFDLPEVQRSFVHEHCCDNMKQAALTLDDISCALCVWLIENPWRFRRNQRSRSESCNAPRARHTG